MLPPTDATQGASTKQEVIRLTTLLDAFTSFAISQGLRLKELMMPARATPDEVLRRFYIVLDLAKKDKGLLFYSFDSRVCGMCSSALPDIPGPSCSDINVINNTIQYNTIQYNTSWGTGTPPGTSLQANYEAHGRIKPIACNRVIVPYPIHLYAFQRAVRQAAWKRYVPEHTPGRSGHQGNQDGHGTQQ